MKKGEKRATRKEEEKQAKQGKRREAKRWKKWRLGLPKVTGNQSKDFLWMEHKIERETPSFLFALKEDDPCRSYNHKVLNKK